jgi:murein DD-endopeptidase MepM/ murein hydrolase activator NlpD
MDKKCLIITLFLLFSVNLCLSQFNTVRNYPVVKRDDEQPILTMKTDSLEWVESADTADTKPIDSIAANRENVNICLPLKHIEITSLFGYRLHPVEKTMMFHAGIDLKAYYEPFYCFADGVVLRMGYDERSGDYLVISHGKLQTVYCHLSRICVKEGDKVSAGQPLGVTGNSGETTAPHLHFGMRKNGVQVDPMKYIAME